ncbi:MAG: prepilin-type N-terminal cleavage/methylation domain-containing protein [Opitutales bacterium]
MNTLNTLIRPSAPRVRRTTRAFTLIELLTVIAIIGILASILIPTVAKVRDTARQSVCGSNIRQITLAMLMFANDNEGMLPGGGSQSSPRDDDWIHWQPAREFRDSGIAGYIGEDFNEALFRCPSDTNYAEFNYPYSYTINTELTAAPYNNPTPRGDFIMGGIDRLDTPTRMIMFIEEADFAARNDAVVFLAGRDKLTRRHGERGNVSFADGHVRTVSPEFVRDPINSSPGY